MENQTTPEKKQEVFIKPWQFYLLLLFSLLGIFFVGYVYHDSLEIERQEHAKTQAELDKERSGKTSCIAIKDSLFRENKRLSVYKPLSLAMIHRDEATTLLKYKVGSIVYQKVDSARVLITDIIIGGSTYNYYIKYKVKYKDKTTEEINPEEVY